MRIIINAVPPSLNRFAGRENTWEYRAEKAKWTKLVYLKCRAAKDRPKTPPEFAGVIITYYFPTRGRHDADNYSGKLLLDGLTKGGAIMDDDFKHIHLSVGGTYDKDNPRTVIDVLEVEQ